MNATFSESDTSTKTNPKPLMCFPHSSSGLMPLGDCVTQPEAAVVALPGSVSPWGWNFPKLIGIWET